MIRKIAMAVLLATTFAGLRGNGTAQARSARSSAALQNYARQIAGIAKQVRAAGRQWEAEVLEAVARGLASGSSRRATARPPRGSDSRGKTVRRTSARSTDRRSTDARARQRAAADRK